jgi:hypothetical protein
MSIFTFELHPSLDESDAVFETGTDPAPEVRVRNAGEALTAAAADLARRGLPWSHPESVECLGVLGFRLWFNPGEDGQSPGSLQPVDVRLDGHVLFTPIHDIG